MGDRVGGLKRVIAAVATFTSLMLISGHDQKAAKVPSQPALIEESLKIATGIKDPASYAWAMCQIAEVLIRLGDNRWRNVMREVVNASQRIEDLYKRAMQLYHAACALKAVDRNWGLR
ncbi:MAG: hypothetical protein RMK89_03620 [Armatimonadota bacterium]|nr:hypothetical protein [Armatimonadota bacterium]MDW8142533.1 hypothetical protein [Armatimonadota bacterium]